MKKISDENIPTSTPKLNDLHRGLSLANELRHKFWSQLRAVRNQAGRYITAHEIDDEEFKKKTASLDPRKRKFYRNEWKTGRAIPLKALRDIVQQCDILHKTSQLVEALKRKNQKTGDKESFFAGAICCVVCRMPLTGRQRKYCSEGCKAIDKSRRWRLKNPEKKAASNYRYLKDTLQDTNI